MIMRVLAFTAVFPIFGTAYAANPGPNVHVPNVAGPREVTMSISDYGFGERHSFPNIRNWNSLVITLERTACFGSCPDYAVEIRGDGEVHYHGRYCVATKGERSVRVSKNEVERL